MGEPERTATETVASSVWSSTPAIPPKRSWHGVLVLVLPLLVVIGPVIGMKVGAITPHRILFCFGVGLGGVIALQLAGRFAPSNASRLAIVAVVAVGVTVVVSKTSAPRYGVWMGGGLALAGWLVGLEGLDRGVARAMKALGNVFAFILFVPLGLLFVVLPWIVNTIVRLDPLRAPTTATSAWLARRRLEVRPSQPWASDAPTARLGGWYRVRSALVWPALALLVLVAIEGPPRSGGSGRKLEIVRPLDTARPAVGSSGKPVVTPFENSDWHEEYLKDTAWISSPLTALQPLRPHRIGDAKTKYVNIRDGVRASWHPPACDCKRLKVWLYGGSTAFGLGQRDAHTIASELARVAWAHGIALDVDNRGVVGDVHWQESNRYAWDVATYGPPDLVIFYDGINDATATQSLVNAHVGDVYAQVDFQNDDFWEQYLKQNPPAKLVPLEGASVPKPPTVITDTPAEFAKLLMKRYHRSRLMSADVSDANKVRTYYLWQPSRLSRPQIPGEPADEPGAADGRKRDAAIEAALPPGVINLMDVFDDNHDALFYDDQHHNEEGAHIMGVAIFRKLRADLERLEAGKKLPPPKKSSF